MLKLGDFYASENESLEFKDFYFKVEPEILLLDSEIQKIVLSGKWHDKLNKLIDININKYLKSYIPKYISCYMNSKINGNLIIGIDDIGEITGIPYQGELNKKKIYNYVKKIIRKYTTGLPNDKNITINIIKLKNDVNCLEDSVKTQIDVLKSKKNEYKKKINDYCEKKKKWMKELNKYSTKFYNILNNKESRQRVIKYCKENCPYQDIIDYIDNYNVIDVTCNTNLYKRFRDEKDVMYWAGKYKDDNIERLKLSKPSRKDLPKLINYSLILRKISDMRFRFISNNKNINYFLINININGDSNVNNVKFRINSKSDEWYQRNRIILSSGPGCI